MRDEQTLTQESEVKLRGKEDRERSQPIDDYSERGILSPSPVRNWAESSRQNLGICTICTNL